MSWQDVVLAGGGFVLSVGLIPALRAPSKPPLRTSGAMVIVLVAYVVTLATLELWLATASTALQAGVWMILAMQQARRWRTARGPGGR